MRGMLNSFLFFVFFGVLRLAQTPEPGLKEVSHPVAKVLEQRNRINLTPQYCGPTIHPIALGVNSHQQLVLHTSGCNVKNQSF